MQLWFDITDTLNLTVSAPNEALGRRAGSKGATPLLRSLTTAASQTAKFGATSFRAAAPAFLTLSVFVGALFKCLV